MVRGRNTGGRSTRDNPEMSNSRRAVTAVSAVSTDALSSTDEEASTTSVSRSTNVESISRSTSVETVVNKEQEELSPEEQVAEAAWNLFQLREVKLKADLHAEFLNIYLTENIYPKGLTVPLKPKVLRRREEFLKKWQNLMDETSVKATALLREYWKDEQKDLKEEVRKTDEERKGLLGEEDKEAHDNDMVEILKYKEEELRKSKEKKLQRDRKLQKERKRNPPGSKPNFAQIATMHIRMKLETTKARPKKANLQENSSD